MITMRILEMLLKAFYFLTGRFEEKVLESHSFKYNDVPHVKIQTTKPNEDWLKVERSWRREEKEIAERVICPTSLEVLTDKLAALTDGELRQVNRYINDEVKRKKDLK